MSQVELQGGPRVLTGKIALVTGGSKGIGAACARIFAANGATVLVGYNRDAAGALQVASGLVGDEHTTIQLPLEDQQLHEQAARQIAERHGRLDILVNSAGSTRKIDHRDLEALTPDLFKEIVDTNLIGTYSVIRAMRHLLQASGDGLVVNISSLAATSGRGSNLAYGAAKAGLETLTVSLARALGPHVRVLAVAPGSVDTNFVPGRTRADLDMVAARTPIGKVVSASDVAEAVFACAVHLRSATGSRILVDGGQAIGSL